MIILFDNTCRYMANWLQKYRPTKLENVIGDKSKFEKLDIFLKQFAVDDFDPANIMFPNIIISGTNGIGKSLIVDISMAINNFEKASVDLSTIVSSRQKRTGDEVKKKKISDEQTSNARSILSLYKNIAGSYAMTDLGQFVRKNGSYDRRRIAVIFDDVSNISTAKEKDAIKSLIKLNNKMKMFPIIVITNTKHSKNVTEIKKMLKYTIKEEIKSPIVDKKSKKIYRNKKVDSEISLSPPSYHDMEKLIKEISRKEKINFLYNKNDDKDIYEEIIIHSQYDIRRMINMLEQLKMIYDNDKISFSEFDDYCQISKTKDQDPGIHQASYDLLNTYTNISSAIHIYEKERSAIPMLIHENYMPNIGEQFPKISIDDQLDIMGKISKSVSYSDMVDGLIYSNQCWSLQPLHGHYSCVYPSYIANSIKGSLRKFVKQEYTQDFNRTSIKKINNKAIKAARKNPKMKRYSVEDFMYMSAILKELVKRKDFEEIARRMKIYGLKWKEVESIIKIDKIKNNKSDKQTSILPSKEKNIMLELLDVSE